MEKGNDAAVMTGIKPLYFDNFNLENIVTPIRVGELEKLLWETKYNPVKTDFIVDGFKNGFDIGYQGKQNVQFRSKNLKFKGVGNKTLLWNKVMKEVQLKYYAGPFEQIPFENFIQSPIGLVPKDGGKDVRLIFHLSHPCDQGLSVNENTLKHKCTVTYPGFDMAIRLCMEARRDCKLAKSDFRSAFRNAPLNRKSWQWTVIFAVSPIDGKDYFFIDKYLPFGVAISCTVFQSISDAIAHIVKCKTKKELVNYLDDFLFVALLRAWCDGQVQVFLDICKIINFLISLEKTFWASPTMVLLGFLIDPLNQTVSIPIEKVDKGLELITQLINKNSKKTTVKALQQICGFLNFLGRAVVPGRSFTRRLYMKLDSKLKPHHHIHIDREMKEDLHMWRTFLQEPELYCRPFMDFANTLQADQIQMFSDASRNKRLGFGAICQDSWCYGQWNEHFMNEN